MKMSLPIGIWSEKQSMKLTDFPVKKAFLGSKSFKKIIATVFKDMKKTITIDFHAKDTIANSASYCLLLWQNSPYLLKIPVCIYIYIYIYNFYFYCYFYKSGGEKKKPRNTICK